jgi:hypothetical protein
MNLKNNLLITLFCLLIIISAGIMGYVQFKHVKEVANSYQTNLIQDYGKNNNLSNLTQAVVIWLKEDNFNLLAKEYIVRGRCKQAETILRLSKQPIFPQVLECYIENRLVDDILEYERHLKRSDVEEIKKFISLKNDRKAYKIEASPSTNLGKISNMILENNFRKYQVTSRLGNQIESLNEKYPKDNELGLSVAKLFLKESFPHISLYIINNLKKDYVCSEEIFNFENEIYTNLGNHSALVESSKDFLSCDPINLKALKTIIEYGEGYNSDTAIYKERLKLIKDLE